MINSGSGCGSDAGETSGIRDLPIKGSTLPFYRLKQRNNMAQQQISAKKQQGTYCSPHLPLGLSMLTSRKSCNYSTPTSRTLSKTLPPKLAMSSRKSMNTSE